MRFLFRTLVFKTLGLAIALSLPVTAHAVSKASVENQFEAWVQKDLWPEASAAGVSKQSFTKAFAGVSLNWDLPDLVPPGSKPPKERKQSQAEFSSPGSYFSEKRLRGLAASGRTLAATHAATLKRIERAYGVPGPIILAIWGRESGFGRADIPHAEIEVLATKAFMSTRKDLFRKELIAALQIVERGDVPPSALKGSWAGAMGQPQFMPTSYLNYAVDFDGDGHRDIWNSVPDSLASIANYLQQKGWQAGRTWGYEVSIPGNVSCAQEGPDLSRPVAQWSSLGITRISGKAFPKAEMQADGMMLVPAGRHGPEFIVSPNFYVLKEYNNSDLYALFIGNLADRIAYGSGPFKAQWGDVGKMLRSDVLAMQQALVAKGYDVGKVDGLPGFKTRRSLGDWQQKSGLVPTCFPDASLKARMR
ncbi:lytic murein transglycosylase [Rhizobiaceae bacterium n13]|uniref:Lytic murein transglycosylase n=1 Tax=Ferirhizobium litorale TaxID=2927786 RepID=A0AAE3QFD6_9HYPH|nr:lytic murein transglycosylase [Fererhizobium litorale]MDI7862931.1 lytic murein transglycosylase [Fererhizobium litorale]MDI7924016.1 lytic murein transglycosylase [Fererhizobium litorale]